MTLITTAPAITAGSARALPKPAYRPDIDGLRAVAVAGVIAFHYGFGPLGGGFTGVDIFFVISGTLITAILRQGWPDAAFLAGFAERRVRRILPALLVVVAACCLASVLVLLPNDLQTVGLGLVNAVVFNANHYVASLTTDYFAAGALASDPMLHTWSLAVEAQFYLVFALIWAAGRRQPARRGLAIALLATLSFAGSVAAVVHRPEAAFYLMPARFWEFMVGAVLTLPRSRLEGPRLASAAAVAGLALIGTGFLAYTPQTPFPGAAALLPCLGAALTIRGGLTPNRVSRLLGARPLVRVGGLSYTLYLWHWPVLVFASYGWPTPLPWLERAGLLVLTILLSALTTRFIERPLIARRRLAQPRRLLLACAGSTLAVAAAGLVVNLAGQNRISLGTLPPAVQRYADGRLDTVALHCPVGAGADPGCRFGAPAVEPTVALWGNSFARQWMPALEAAARRRGAAGTALLIVRCPPFLDMAFPTLRGCEAFNRDALAFLDAHPALRTVVLGGNWNEWAADLPALRHTIAVLQGRGRRVALILSPPAVPYLVPRTLALAALRHRPPPPLVAEAEARAARARETALIESLQTGRPITVVDPFEAFCDGRTCAVEADGHPFYYDDRHVTQFGAARAGPLFDPVFDETGAP